LTIMLETGPIARFAQVGDYASYCRKVSSRWTSNEKTKGKGGLLQIEWVNFDRKWELSIGR